MNPEAILGLISNLYTQIIALQKQVEELTANDRPNPSDS